MWNVINAIKDLIVLFLGTKTLTKHVEEPRNLVYDCCGITLKPSLHFKNTNLIMKKNKFKCYLCRKKEFGKGFTTENSLSAHMEYNNYNFRLRRDNTSVIRTLFKCQ